MSDQKKTHITIQSPGPDYDPKRHITVDELHDLGKGTFIPKTIPGCAWIPRANLDMDFTVNDAPEPEPEPGSQGKITGTIRLGVGGMFVWQEYRMVVDGEVKPEDIPLVEGVEIVKGPNDG
jgi:hypothetical protein